MLLKSTRNVIYLIIFIKYKNNDITLIYIYIKLDNL